MIVVDTSVWVSRINSVSTVHTQWLQEHRTDDVALTDGILTEILQGMRTDHQYAAVKQRLLTLPVFNTGGEALAIASAQNFRWLRKRGITIRSTIDSIIATFCIEQGYGLLHNDRDFEPFEKHLGLKVIHP